MARRKVKHPGEDASQGKGHDDVVKLLLDKDAQTEEANPTLSKLTLTDFQIP